MIRFEFCAELEAVLIVEISASVGIGFEGRPAGP
jgi:hypothetical protein